MRWLIRLIACVLLAGCGGPGSVGDWSTVRRGDLVRTVDVSGSLKSTDSVLLGPPTVRSVWNYTITFLATEGEDVEEGDKVLAFDVKELRQRLLSEQNTAKSKAKELEKKLTSTTMARRDEELKLAEVEAEVRRARMPASASPDLVASVGLRTAQLDLQLAEAKLASETRKAAGAARRDAAELESMRAELDRANRRVADLQADIERMTVKAPRAGAVLLSARRGRDKPKVGDRLWRALKPVAIVALDDLFGDGEVDEMDASRIAVGQPVKLKLDAHPDAQLTGTVEVVRRSVQRRSREDPRKVVRVEVSVDPTETVSLRPGMRFRGGIEIERIEEAILVPLEAVFAGPDGPFVWLESGLRAEPVTVTLGARNTRDVVVLSGLDAGDRVALTAPEDS